LAWQIEMTGTASKQLGKLDKGEAKRITGFLRQRLAAMDDPRSLGKVLKGPLLGEYWRYRVGNFRVICDIQDNRVCVLVIEIGNRGKVYR